MRRQTRQDPCGCRACLLYVEPLEDRQLLSGLSAGAGTSHSGEYAHTSHPAEKATVHYGQASNAYASAGPQSSYDSTGYGSSYDSSSYAATPKQAKSPATRETYGTPSETYAATSDSTPQPSATPADQPNVLGAAAAVVEQAGQSAANRSGAVEPAGDKTQPLPSAAVETTAQRPAEGIVLVADAGRVSTERATVSGAHPPTPAEVAWLPAAVSGSRTVDPDPGTEDPFDPVPGSSESQPTEPMPQLGSLLSGTVPVDLAVLHRGIDQFFSRLEELGKELPTGPVIVRLLPWIVTVSVATAALELARWQMKKQYPRRSGWIARPTLDQS
jgi:hypothetical protein